MLDQKKKQRALEEFAHLKDIVYLNTGSTAVPPACVRRAYADDMREFVENYGMTHHNHNSQIRLKEMLAKLIGGQPAEIALTGNTTDGFDVITMGYPWNPEKDVILYGYEHPSNLVNWVKQEELGRLRLKIADPGENGISAENIISQIDDNTQAVAVSLVQYWDGARVDINAIGKACREKGALLIVDAIQAMGRLKVDVQEAGIDFLSSGGHKGLLARTGTGFLYCSKKLLEIVEAYHGSFMSTSRFTKIAYPDYDKKIHWLPDARRFEAGNHNDQGYSGMLAAQELIHEMGIMQIESEILHLQDYFYKELGNLAERVKPRGDMASGIIYIQFPEGKKEEAGQILARYKIYASLRLSNIRLCINFHNTEEEMAAAAKACREILAL